MNYKFYKKLFSIIGLNFVLVSFTGCSDKGDVESFEHDYSNASTSSITAGTTECLTNITQCIYYESFLSTSSIIYIGSTDDLSTTDITFNSDNSECLTITENDAIVLDYFSELGDIIKSNIDSDELLEYGKKYFIYCVDFLFYDGEVDGITFSDMTESAKEQLLIDISTIDSLICSRYPDYKEKIREGYGSVYNKACEIIIDGSRNISDFSKEKLGEDNYNRLGEYKDLFVDTAFGDFDDFLDIVGNGKEKVKTWYEGLK